MQIKPSADVLNAIASLPVNRITVKPKVAPAQPVKPASSVQAAKKTDKHSANQASANQSAGPAINPSRYYRPGTILDIYV
jgi:hypothetical protein